LSSPHQYDGLAKLKRRFEIKIVDDYTSFKTKSELNSFTRPKVAVALKSRTRTRTSSIVKLRLLWKSLQQIDDGMLPYKNTEKHLNIIFKINNELLIFKTLKMRCIDICVQNNVV